MELTYVLVALLLVAIIYKFMRKVKPTYPEILLIGASGSGKTLLFHLVKITQLKDKTSPHTVSSMKVNSTDSKEPSMHTLSDIPGHSYFQDTMVKKAKQAKAVILLIDSNDKQSFKAAAEKLYDLLLLKLPKQILIFCNKQDIQMAKSTLIIESDLSTEM